MNIVSFATAWGPRFGGINSFNYDFLIAMAELLGGQGQVYCAVPNPSEEVIELARLMQINIIPLMINGEIDKFERAWVGLAISWLEAMGVKKISIWIGHDTVSGQAAQQASQLMGGEVTLIHHMDYRDYKRFTGSSSDHIDRLERLQRQVFKGAGAFFAVGPRLVSSCCDLSGRDKSSIFELIPGFHQIQNHSPDDRLKVLIYGRMDQATDSLKQGRLAAAAFGKAIYDYGDLQTLKDPRMDVVGIGQDVLPEENEIKEIVFRFSKRRDINVLPLPFDEERDKLLSLLSVSNLAMLLSVREGFGLTAWEAIGAGIPLIVTEFSGVYQLIKERLGGSGLGCLQTVRTNGLAAEELLAKKSGLHRFRPSPTSLCLGSESRVRRPNRCRP